MKKLISLFFPMIIWSQSGKELAIMLEQKAAPKDLKNQTDNKTCVGLKDKSGCASLGGCVWVTSDNGKVKKCQQGNKTGPTDMCYCKPDSKTAKTGKLIPWDEFYYLDDSGSISKGSPKPCMNKDGKCTPS